MGIQWKGLYTRDERRLVQDGKFVVDQFWNWAVLMLLGTHRRVIRILRMLNLSLVLTHWPMLQWYERENISCCNKILWVISKSNDLCIIHIMAETEPLYFLQRMKSLQRWKMGSTLMHEKLRLSKLSNSGQIVSGHKVSKCDSMCQNFSSQNILPDIKLYKHYKIQ